MVLVDGLFKEGFVKLKSILLTVSVALLMLGFAPRTSSAGPLIDPALAFGVGDPYFLGFIVDGTPADMNAEVGFMNDLGLVAAGFMETCATPTNPTENCDRTTSTLAGPFAMATTADYMKQDNSDPTFDVGAMTFQYVLAKYGGYSAIWYNEDGFTGMISPVAQSLSHTSVANKLSVPEPGTLVLLGAGLAMIGLRTRRKQQ